MASKCFIHAFYNRELPMHLFCRNIGRASKNKRSKNQEDKLFQRADTVYMSNDNVIHVRGLRILVIQAPKKVKVLLQLKCAGAVPVLVT